MGRRDRSTVLAVVSCDRDPPQRYRVSTNLGTRHSWIWWTLSSPPLREPRTPSKPKSARGYQSDSRGLCSRSPRPSPCLRRRADKQGRPPSFSDPVTTSGADQDAAAATVALQAALRSSGLSQNAFAAALGTSPPRLSSYLAGTVAPSAPAFLRALRIGNSLAEAAQSGWLSAPATAAVIAKAVASADEPWAFRLLLQGRDHLRQLLTERPKLSAAWEAAPRSTRSDRLEALLAALIAHECRRRLNVRPM